MVSVSNEGEFYLIHGCLGIQHNPADQQAVWNTLHDIFNTLGPLDFRNRSNRPRLDKAILARMDQMPDLLASSGEPQYKVLYWLYDLYRKLKSVWPRPPPQQTQLPAQAQAQPPAKPQRRLRRRSRGQSNAPPQQSQAQPQTQSTTFTIDPR